MSVGIAIPTAAPEFSSPHVCGSAGSYSFMSLRSRKPSKADVCQDFIQKLRDRRGIELEAPGVIEGIQQHFQQLPTRYALDVNIGSLDVLNHKRLLDSARQDPSAVSFQVRPVDVAPGLHGSANMDKRPSFGNLDSLTEVRSALFLPSKPALTFKLWLSGLRSKAGGSIAGCQSPCAEDSQARRLAAASLRFIPQPPGLCMAHHALCLCEGIWTSSCRSARRICALQSLSCLEGCPHESPVRDLEIEGGSLSSASLHRLATTCSACCSTRAA